MSDFRVTVEQIIVTEHPNADALEIAHVADYQSVVRKGTFVDGDLVAYIPEQALVPLDLLREMGLEGKLAGKNRDRVKSVRLRGILSQGLVYPARDGWTEGQDVAAELGITKWEPEIPVAFQGEMGFVGFDKTLKYDIENIKRWPTVLEPGEQVVFTEKLHGTWSLFGCGPGWTTVSSKGLSAQGLGFKLDSVKNETNIYCRVARDLHIHKRLSDFAHGSHGDEPVFLLGEIIGVQDLKYGFTGQLGFRAFDVYVGRPGAGRFLDDAELDEACQQLEVERVPVMYRGPFWHRLLYEYGYGPETVTSTKAHTREGIVIRPSKERQGRFVCVKDGAEHVEFHRVQLKFVNDDYLTRKGEGTEFT
jgi:RNA ligase (TIGR02306 family)